MIWTTDDNFNASWHELDLTAGFTSTVLTLDSCQLRLVCKNAQTKSIFVILHRQWCCSSVQNTFHNRAKFPFWCHRQIKPSYFFCLLILQERDKMRGLIFRNTPVFFSVFPSSIWHQIIDSPTRKKGPSMPAKLIDFSKWGSRKVEWLRHLYRICVRC